MGSLNSRLKPYADMLSGKKGVSTERKANLQKMGKFIGEKKEDESKNQKANF